VFYEILRPFFSIIFRIFYSLKITGSEYIPEHGPVILCANHTSYFDSMLVGLCTKRKVRFIIFEWYYNHWLLGPFIRILKAIPVRSQGINKEATKGVITILKDGGVIGIFPEGRLTRTGQIGPAQQGAALLAVLTNAQIVPITINGAFSVYPKGRMIPRLSGKITVEVHPPLSVDPARRKEKGYLETVTAQIMESIKKSLILPQSPATNH
jgi:1-acyl-sn-glycerol-3-phosphate acyltransferase